MPFTSNRTLGWNRQLALMCATLCVTLGSLSCASVLAASSGSIPSRAAKVAGGHNARSSWGIWLFGARGKGCWGTRTVEQKQVAGESVTCGLSVPSHLVQLAVTGSVPGKDGPKSVLFFLTRLPDVKGLKVLIQPERRSPRWVTIRGRRLNPARRSAARVPARVGFAIRLVDGRGVCARRVVALDAEGQAIGRESFRGCKRQ